MEPSNPYAPPAAEVEDIYDPAAPVELADRATRLGAFLLDSVILGAMVYAPLFVSFALTAAMNRPNPGVLVGGILVGLGGFVIWCWLTIRGVMRSGQSIGKKLLAIRVVRTDGSPASLGRIFWLRNVVNAVLSLVPVYWVIDPMFIFSDSRQCLHDKIADTIVIRA
jgi:uncharacterized RDD family membrane protein YckC